MQKCCQEIHCFQVLILSMELFFTDVFLQGDSDIDQLFHIVKCLGENLMPQSEKCNFHLQVLSARDTGTSLQKIQCTGKAFVAHKEIFVVDSEPNLISTVENTVHFMLVNQFM